MGNLDVHRTNPKSTVQSAMPELFPLAVLALLTILGSMAGAGNAIRLFFIVSSVGIGLYLHSKSISSYVSFTLWIWFLSPLLRRVVDYYNGFDGLGIMVVAPYLVTMITAIKIVRSLSQLFESENAAFILPLTAIAYSFCIGWLNNSTLAVIRAALDWFPPVILALYLSINWHLYPQLKQSFQTTFTWGTLLMGIYGIFQYLVAPDWDIYWMNNASIGSVGQPTPLGIRVWSTMNAPGPFSSVISSGLLLLLSHKSLFFVPTYLTGFLSFLLSGVRAAWLGWVLGQSMLMSSVKSRLQIRLVLIGVFLALILIPLSMAEPFQERVGDRLSTFSDIGEDDSFQARSATYQENIWLALSSFLGRGLGGTLVLSETGGAVKVALDSGILDIFFTLGWIGALPYLMGLLVLFLRQFLLTNSFNDVFVSAARAISIAHVFQLLFGNTATGVAGIMLWSFLGFNLAAHKYYRYQKKYASQLLHS